MSRVIAGLVAFSLVPLFASAQTTQTFVTQTPDGAIVSGTMSTAITAIAGQGPARDTQPARTGTSRIRGRVVAAENGQPLRRVSVRLNSPELREGKSTVTDDDGRYELRDLPSGRYNLSVSKNGFVTISYGQRRPNEPGRPLELADKQLADRVDFALPRAGIITGRIVDEYGEPVANAMVQPLRLTVINGEQRQMPSGPMATTPDTGEFRLWGLIPGEYLIVVNSQRMFNMEPSDDRSGYVPTYYPGTPNSAEAQPISLSVGQTAGGIDIMLLPARTARITGTTLNAKGQPLRGGFVNAMPRSRNSGMMGPSAGGQIKPDGTWTLTGLPPGEYVLRGNGQPQGPGTPPEQLVANVTVGSEDVTGVVLTPVQPIKLTGKITLDPPTGWLQPSMVRVMAMPKEPGAMFFATPVGPPIVHDDFTFEIAGQPGTMLIRAMPVGAVASTLWAVKSVRLENEEVIDSGVEMTAGRDLSGVEIIVTNRVQTVTGVVTNDRGEVAGEATVMIFPQGREQRPNSRFNATVRLDQNGRYSTRTLPPGEYFAVAVDYVDPNRRMEPGLLEELSRSAIQFSIAEGQTRTVDLKVSSH
jgi:hypothetical protein